MPNRSVDADLDSILSDLSNKNNQFTYEKFNVYNSNEDEDGDGQSQLGDELSELNCDTKISQGDEVVGCELPAETETSPQTITHRSQAKSISSFNEVARAPVISPSQSNFTILKQEEASDVDNSAEVLLDHERYERQIEIQIQIDDTLGDDDNLDNERYSDSEFTTSPNSSDNSTDAISVDKDKSFADKSASTTPIKLQDLPENEGKIVSSSNQSSISKSNNVTPDSNEFCFNESLAKSRRKSVIPPSKPLPSIPLGAILSNPDSATDGTTSKLRKSKSKISPIDQIPKQIKLIYELTNFNKLYKNTSVLDDTSEIDSKVFKNIQDFGKFLLSYLTTLSNFELIMNNSYDSDVYDDDMNFKSSEARKGKLLTDNLFISNEIWFNNLLVIKDCTIKVDIMHDINNLLIGLISNITSKDTLKAEIDFTKIDTSLLYYEKLLKAYNVYEIPVLQIQYNNEKYHNGIETEKENYITPQQSTNSFSSLSRSTTSNSNSVSKYQSNKRLSNQSFSIIKGNSNVSHDCAAGNGKTGSSFQSSQSQSTRHESWTNNNITSNDNDNNDNNNINSKFDNDHNDNTSNNNHDKSSNSSNIIGDVHNKNNDNDNSNKNNSNMAGYSSNSNTRTVYRKLSFFSNKLKHKRSVSGAANTTNIPKTSFDTNFITNTTSISNNLEIIHLNAAEGPKNQSSKALSNSFTASQPSSAIQREKKLSVSEIKQQKYDYYKCLIILKENYQILFGMINKAKKDQSQKILSDSEIEQFNKILEFLVKSIVRFNLIDVLLLNIELVKSRLDIFLNF